MQYQTFNSEYVQRLTEGDPEVERHFVAYFSELLLIKLRRSLRSYQAREDVRQETFLRVFRVLRSPGGLASPEKLGAFVNGVCNNIVAEHYRASARLSPLPDSGLDPQALELDPEEGLVSEEGKRGVRAMLDRMPAKDRLILRLLFIEERAKDEVCGICQVDRNYLRVLLHRAKNRFREALGHPRAAQKASALPAGRSARAC